MHVVMAGGSGFLGTRLIARLTSRGDEVTILTRRASPDSAAGRVRKVAWRADGEAEPALVPVIGAADAIVNLCGAGIADKRWSAARKQVLRDSRVLPTRSLVKALAAAPARPRVFVQGSAVGYYGASLDAALLDESSPAGDDFLGRLCADWEREAAPAAAAGCRLVLQRTSPVLASRGGVLGRMKPPFLLFVGGPVAPGRQYFSWVHHEDWTSMALWALDTAAVAGPINNTSPNPVTNAEFSKALGRALGRPSWLTVPEFALRILVGELAEDVLIKGQRAVPARATALGFPFRFPQLDAALADIFAR